jgi:uncharacterized damage-inducible protein DinB
MVTEFTGAGMYSSINDFLTEWTDELHATLRIFDALTDNALDRRVDDQGRSIREIAWHIVTTIPEMMQRVGISPEGAGEHDAAPESAERISAAYSGVAHSLLGILKERWTDADLRVEHDMYGERWSNARTLRVLVMHQAHHRAQLTVLMRQSGLRVPGIYGPSREEWEAIGLPIQP